MIPQITPTTQIWFITGISSGLGQAIAESAMQHGHFVVGTMRNPAQIQAFNEKYAGKGLAVQLDITNASDCDAFVASFKNSIGRLDVLVNNAGIGFIGAIEEASETEIREVFEANVFGTMRLTTAFLPIFRAQQRGHIVQISSHGGIKAFAGFGVYNASKFALEGFSEALAQEIEPLGIKLSLIEPGPFRTNFAGNSLREAAQTLASYDATSGAFRKRMKELVHGNQEGDPAKAAEAIVRIVREAAQTGKAPLRVPIGKTALLTISAKLESVKNDVEAARNMAESVVY